MRRQRQVRWNCVHKRSRRFGTVQQRFLGMLESLVMALCAHDAEVATNGVARGHPQRLHCAVPSLQRRPRLPVRARSACHPGSVRVPAAPQAPLSGVRPPVCGVPDISRISGPADHRSLPAWSAEPERRGRPTIRIPVALLFRRAGRIRQGGAWDLWIPARRIADCPQETAAAWTSAPSTVQRGDPQWVPR